MEKKRSPVQVYAIIINVVAVVTLLICLSNLIFSAIDRSDPLYAGRSEVNLSSFENFKMDVLKEVNSDQAYIPDDATIQKMFDSAVEDKVKRTLHTANRNIMVNSIIGGIALLLFLVHWVILKRSAGNNS